MPYLGQHCAFEKPDGGVRPIAVGSFYRRLAGKMAARHASSLLSSELSPVQLGVGTRGGCEALVHAFRQYSTSVSQNQSLSTHVAVKLNIKNAFNSILRKIVLSEILKRCPEIYPIAWQAYSTSTPLFIGDHIISS